MIRMGGIRPDPIFMAEWLDEYITTVILFAVNCNASYAQIDKMLRQKIEELEVDIIEGH